MIRIVSISILSLLMFLPNSILAQDTLIIGKDTLITKISVWNKKDNTIKSDSVIHPTVTDSAGKTVLLENCFAQANYFPSFCIEMGISGTAYYELVVSPQGEIKEVIEKRSVHGCHEFDKNFVAYCGSFEKINHTEDLLVKLDFRVIYGPLEQVDPIEIRVIRR